jgi:hypothetical protein
MQVGDFIEDTFRSFNGEITAVVRGVITEVDERYEIIKYYCSQIHYSETSSVDTMLGTLVKRNMRTCTVLSQRGGKMGKSG